MNRKPNNYTGYCKNNDCTNQLPINAQSNRLYCNVCQVERKKLQLAVIIKNRRQFIKERKLLEAKIVA